jgi:hypothetical protein
MQGSGSDGSSDPGGQAAAQPARQSKTQPRHITDGGVHEHTRSPRFDGDGIVDRSIAQGEQGPAPPSKAVKGRPPKVIWRFAPDDRSRQQRLVRLLFEQDTEQEQVQGGD